MDNQIANTILQNQLQLPFVDTLAQNKTPGLTETKPPYRVGQWSTSEEERYFQFLFHNRVQFKSQALRKSSKIFKRMFRFVKTRNPCQCRTHHQNIMKKFKRNVDKAIESHYQENLRFFEKYAKVKPKLQVLEDDWEFYEDYEIAKKDQLMEKRQNIKSLQSVKQMNNIIQNQLIITPKMIGLEKNLDEVKVENVTNSIIFTQTTINDNPETRKTSKNTQPKIKLDSPLNQNQAGLAKSPTFLINIDKFNQQNMTSNMYCNNKNIGNPNLDINSFNDRMMKVMECHYLYFEWMERLSMLIHFLQ